MTVPDTSWRDDAECSEHPTWLFFSDATIDLAKRVCARCPVINECLDHAIANGEEGVWGGTSDRDGNVVTVESHMAAHRSGWEKAQRAGRGKSADLIVVDEPERPAAS